MKTTQKLEGRMRKWAFFAALVFSTSFIPHPSFCQTVLTAPGIAAYATTPPTGGGGGGCTPSYSNTGGTGNRLSIITFSKSDPTWSWGGTANKIIDGDTTSNGQFFFGGVSLGSTIWMQWDFGAGNQVLITEAKFYQQTATAQGTWQWQGSNDGSSFSNIGSSFALGTSATQTITALSGNATKYRIYRMVGVSGSTSTGPWVYEMEFKICQ